MGTQVLGILAMRCGFCVPETVFAGGGKCACLIVGYQQVNREVIGLPFPGR